MVCVMNDINDFPPGKVCAKCEDMKSWDEFHRDRTQKDGFKSICKPCRSGVQRQYRVEKAQPDKSEYDRMLSQAKQLALKRLVDNHWTEFTQLVSRYKREVGIKPTWKSICD